MSNKPKLTVFCVEVYANEESEVSEKTSEKVIEAIRQNPKITAEELSRMLGITRRGIEFSIKSLREQGVIKRERGRNLLIPLYFVTLRSERFLSTCARDEL